MSVPAIVEVKNLYKFYRAREFAVDKHAALRMLQKNATNEAVLEKTGVTAAAVDISFEAGRGEIFVLIGLSGSGKSTILRCINMLNPPTFGKVFIEGEDVTAYGERRLLELRRTKIAMVFQHFGLMTHRNVLSNVCYGLEVRGVDKKAREAKGMEMLAMVGLEGCEGTPINKLSGGMKQRVGIARALANDPDILLMDEAFSALDPLVKNDLQFELMRIQNKMKKTIIFITHDINEAFRIGTRVGILRDGRMVQEGTPEDMLSSPADDYVRKFTNSVDVRQVLSVRNVISTPTCMIKMGDGIHMALAFMRNSGVSSAYIVGDHLNFIGLMTLENALLVRDGKKTFSEAIVRDLQIVRDINAPVADIIPLAAEAKYPLVVLDESDLFRGIITKASVLSFF
ncbi:MAG: betaine/proline/choline family ABC transporter ATP-binding protein [Acidaminococcales bacterium]|nr:betaine/proline/choline family ABC transporter ATP-binding protein [Acidaminococcales bacterium]